MNLVNLITTATHPARDRQDEKLPVIYQYIKVMR